MKKLMILLLVLFSSQLFAGMSNEELTSIANELNKSTPMMVDKETRLDNVMGFENTLTYYYTLVNYSSQTINSDFGDNMDRILTNKVCSSPDVAIFFKKGVALGFYYNGNDDRFISKVVLTPRTCGY